MTENHAAAVPGADLFYGEMGSLPGLYRARFLPRRFPLSKQANGEPVMVVPGFCAADATTRQLRLNLRHAGFDVRGWGQGRNWGARVDIVNGLAEAITRFAADRGRPVHLVGWSLGGVMAREYAKQAPNDVASVISMGSPISGSRRDNHAWRMYEIIAGHDVDNPPVDVNLETKPPVLTYAMWSRKDGIVAAHAARGSEGSADIVREVDCTHIGFATDAIAFKTLVDCLSDAERSIAAIN